MSYKDDIVEMALKIVQDKINEREMVIEQFKESKKDTQTLEVQNLEMSTAIIVLKQWLGCY